MKSESSSKEAQSPLSPYLATHGDGMTSVAVVIPQPLQQKFLFHKGNSEFHSSEDHVFLEYLLDSLSFIGQLGSYFLQFSLSWCTLPLWVYYFVSRSSFVSRSGLISRSQFVLCRSFCHFLSAVEVTSSPSPILFRPFATFPFSVSARDAVLWPE